MSGKPIAKRFRYSHQSPLFDQAFSTAVMVLEPEYDPLGLPDGMLIPHQMRAEAGVWV